MCYNKKEFKIENDPIMNTRNDFLWGVNTKNCHFRAYKTEFLDDRYYAMSKLGVQIVRMQQSNFDHLDKDIAFANAYGIKVMLNIGDVRALYKEYNSEKAFEYAKMIANRYNGKNGHGRVDYFCIDNELDNYLAGLSKNAGIDFADGTDMHKEYIEEEARKVCSRVKDYIAGVRDADTDAQTVINTCWTHYGLHDWFEECGVDYDIYGLDWYMDMTRAFKKQGKAPLEFTDFVYKRYGKPVMICESNEWSYEPLDEEDPTTWDELAETMKDAYSRSHIIGYITYELCDNEMGKTDEEQGKYDRENHFGLLYMDKNDKSKIIGEKAVCKRLKRMWAPQPKKRITFEELGFKL